MTKTAPAHSTEEVLEALDYATNSENPSMTSAITDAIAHFGSLLAGHESEERIQYCQRENLNPDDPNYDETYAYYYSRTWDDLYATVTF